jgi:hypothetical protein
VERHSEQRSDALDRRGRVCHHLPQAVVDSVFERAFVSAKSKRRMSDKLGLTDFDKYSVKGLHLLAEKHGKMGVLTTNALELTDLLAAECKKWNITVLTGYGGGLVAGV